MRMPMFILVFCLLTTATHASATEWELIWSDEFNYTGLPDKTKWSYEVGFSRNEELQYYTMGRKENARVENGMLIIEARKEKCINQKYKPNSTNWREAGEVARYTSASLTTLNKGHWKYGRLEIRAKLPQGAGVWPAIWTLGVNMSQVGYPKCSEIDIMEFFGKEPNQITSNTHYEANGKRQSSPGKITVDKPYADFHIYAIEWYQDRIDFFFDNIKYHSFRLDNAGQELDNPFRKDHYLLINLALGGNSGGPIDDSNLPQKYLVDYVRIYKEKETGS